MAKPQPNPGKTGSTGSPSNPTINPQPQQPDNSFVKDLINAYKNQFQGIGKEDILSTTWEIGWAWLMILLGIMVVTFSIIPFVSEYYVFLGLVLAAIFAIIFFATSRKLFSVEMGTFLLLMGISNAIITFLRPTWLGITAQYQFIVAINVTTGIIFFSLTESIRMKGTAVIFTIFDLFSQYMILAIGGTTPVLFGFFAVMDVLVWIFSLKWLCFGAINYFLIKDKFAKDNMEVPDGIKWLNTIFALLMLGLIIFNIPAIIKHTPIQYTDSVDMLRAQYTIKEKAEEIKEETTEYINETASAWKQGLTAFKCLLMGDLECYEKALQSQQEKIEGEIGLGQNVFIEFEPALYQQDEFYSADTILLAGHIKVVDLRNSIKNISLTCEINSSNKQYNDNPTPIPDKIEVDLGYVDEDIVCSPSENMRDELVDSSYITTLKANINGIKTTTRLTNLVIDKDSLNSQIIAYTKENDVSYATITRNSILRSLFPELINSIYPKGEVISQSEEESLLSINMKTTDDFIIGLDDDSNNLLLQAEMINNGQGIAEVSRIEIKLPEYVIVDTETTCKGYTEENNMLTFDVKKGTIEKGKKLPIPNCLLSIEHDAVTNNPNFPEQLTFEVNADFSYSLSTNIFFKYQDIEKQQQKLEKELSET